MKKEVLRLAGLLACVALATSRIGLIAHELVAHGGVALLCGARISEVQMFWFAGGWIRYTLPEPNLAASLAISMAGIALELVVGLTLWLALRPGSLGRRLVRGTGLALVVHATWYLATGAFHGFGDGQILYRELGQARVPVAIAAGLATCAASYAGARLVVRPLLATLTGTPRAQLAGLVVAALLAVGLHGALTIGELQLRRDASYAQVMRPERERVIAHELQQWQREQVERGIEPTVQARREQQRRLERTHRSFPFVITLAIATLLSVIAGAWRSPAGGGERISARLVAWAVAIALAAIWLVIMIDGAVSPTR